MSRDDFNIENFPVNLEKTLDAYSIVAITNSRGIIVHANDNFCQISKYSRKELLGKDHRLINSGFHPKSFFRNLWSTIKSGNTWHGEIKNKAKDGSLYWTDTHIVPQMNHDGQVEHYVAVRVDITSKKEMEEKNTRQQKQLLVADKMASLGILTSGVAHEINNPNHLILSNTQILQKAWTDVMLVLSEYYDEIGDFELAGLPFQEMKEQIPQMLLRIQGGAERIKAIVDTLKGFAREEDESMEQQIHINVVVKSTLTLVSNLLKKSTNQFSLKLNEDIPPFLGNFQQIEQVLINFITNSCQALSDVEQRICISTSYRAEDQMVVLEVMDDGCGIKPEVMKKILDPFFTTKRDSGGTGLGLFVSFGIIQKHNGNIEFKSEENKGCKVRVLLPSIEKK